MKTSLFCFVIAVSQIILLQGAIPEHKASNVPPGMTLIPLNQTFINTMFVDIMNKHLATAYNQINTDPMITRKKNNTAAILLNGIAQICAYIGSIFGAHNKRDKHLGLLNVAATVCNVAAQLAAHSEKPVKPKEQPEQAAIQLETIDNNDTHKELIACKLADLTNSLLEELEKEQLKNLIALPETLALIRSMPSPEERQELIAVILETPKLAAQYLVELFTALGSYVTTNGSLLTEIIREKISGYLNDRSTVTQAKLAQITDTKTAITPNNLKSGITIYAHAPQKYSPEVLDYLTDGFIDLLQGQLKQVLGADQNTTTPQVLEALQEALIRLYCA